MNELVVAPCSTVDHGHGRPIVLLIYRAAISRRCSRRPMYVNDLQIYCLTAEPDKTTTLQDQLVICIDEFSTWLRSNRMQLNTAN